MYLKSSNYSSDVKLAVLVDGEKHTLESLSTYFKTKDSLVPWQGTSMMKVFILEDPDFNESSLHV